VPSALGVNPQLTIMALATRLAFGLLGQAVPGVPQASSAVPQPHDEEAPCPS
jgi:choline dehydrogenase-like flavoprotein